MIAALLATLALVFVWLGGAFLLRGIVSTRPFSMAQPLHASTTLGLGFFVGLAFQYLTFSLIARSLEFHWALPASLALLASVAVATRYLSRKISAGPPAPAASGKEAELDAAFTARAWLTWAFLILIGLHLTLTVVEILHRPVFPWDAWHNWMYRAKVWFLTGELAPMDDIRDWARGSVTHRYVVAGAHYPALVPITAVWFSTALGGWSETLVNIPYFFCGLAMVFALYGLGRDAGRSPRVSAILAYLLISIPLIGSHLSLAGQADIFMAAFCGLGFSVLLLAACERNSGLAALGLCLVAVGTLIKVEGSVWLLAGLLFTAVTFKPRVSLLVVACFILSAAVLATLGIRQVELPILGTVGVVDERLFVPFLGSYALQSYELGDDYISNFFLGGSWHLLWSMVLAGCVVALVRIRRRRSLVYLSFVTVTVCAQVVIFFFTEQGAWADDWTAINRLPLHFAPAFLYSLLLLASDTTEGVKEEPQDFSRISLGRIGVIVGGGLLATVLISVVFIGLSASQPAQEVLEKNGNELKAMVGRAEDSGSSLRVTSFENNIALLSSGPINIQATDFGLVHLNASGSNQQEFTLFWRRADTGSLHRVKLDAVGPRSVDLTENEHWQRRISELGLVFYEDGGSVDIHKLTITARDGSGLIRKILTDWRAVTPWSQRSVHWLPAGTIDGPLPLPVFALMFIVTSAMLVLLLGRGKPDSSYLWLALLLPWVLLDLRWLGTRVTLASTTSSQYEIGRSGPLVFGDDAFVKEAVDRALCDQRSADSREETPRLLIAGNSEQDMRFQILRAKYHAAPVPAYAHDAEVSSAPLNLAERLLTLKLRYGADPDKTLSSQEIEDTLSRKSFNPRFKPWENQSAYLHVIGSPSDSPTCWAAMLSDVRD